MQMRTETSRPPQPHLPDVQRLGDGGLTLMEFAMRESLPLSVVQDAVFEFLAHRDDAVVFGAQAVNAYVQERRATEVVDVASTRALELAEEIRAFLNARSHIAVRVRDVRDGLGYRIYQVRREGNRHLVDVRPVPSLPPAERVGNVQVVVPIELVAGKVMAYVARQGKPKAFTDRRDIAVLLLTFPDLKTEFGPVRESLLAAGAGTAVLEAWSAIVREPISHEDEDDAF
jgi:hypothetical protein